MNKTSAILEASWASHSLAQRALAYHRVRIYGSLLILSLLVTVQLIFPTSGALIGICITLCDLAILLLQRRITLNGRPKLGTWISLIEAALSGTVGLHLSGGYITLTFGVYIILILGAAFVFWQRSAAYWMGAIVSILFVSFAIAELTGLIGIHNSLLADAYDLSVNARLLYTNIVFGLLLLIIASTAAGGASETLGNWSIQLRKEVERKTATLTDLLAEKEKTYHAIVTTLANVIEVRDAYTSDHSHRIATLAVETARFLGYDEEALERVRLAAILHDIGKIGIPDEILNKPGKLTPEEYVIIQRHPEIGAKIVATIDDMQDIAEIVHAHQEKYNGTGYPKGLKGKDIPKIARIIAVVDAYIAMTDERPYKKPKSKVYAIKELIEESGKHFDPEVVDAFLYVLQLENDIR